MTVYIHRNKNQQKKMTHINIILLQVYLRDPVVQFEVIVLTIFYIMMLSKEKYPNIQLIKKSNKKFKMIVTKNIQLKKAIKY